MAKKNKIFKYYEAVGRRREAVARVRLYLVNKKDKTAKVNKLKIKQGEIYVNYKPISSVFKSKVEEEKYMLPLKLTKNEKRFAISVKIKGGGKNGQLEAMVNGLAKAIEKADKETYRPILKKKGLLTRDPRVRERRKVGTGGKARRKKQSPKR